MTSDQTTPPRSAGAVLQTALLALGLVILVALIAAPGVMERIQYAKVRGELAAIRDAAAVRELAPVGKLFTTLARLIGPTVVNITTTRRVLLPADESVALRSESRGATDIEIGSGVIVAADGVIVTNNHVVDEADRIEVTLADGRRFVAHLVGADEKRDLAVLRIDAAELPAATWGDSDSLEVGEMVWAIGNPYGLDRTLTYGIISAVGRRGVVGNTFGNFLQTDASINPGNSGGPLVDVHGSIMGITTAIAQPGSKGIGFAIPSNTARRVCDEIIRDGFVESGFVGIQPEDPPVGYSTVAGAALVRAVIPNAPADLAGIMSGDLVVAFDGERVAGSTHLSLLILNAEVGSDVTIEILRGDRRLSLPVRVGQQPRR
ncbi:MAG: trypsin-like serine protease [Planctomycetaceae bacterium]|nr:trypsin-like serine protease [Planctomycetaceae bacterium]